MGHSGADHGMGGIEKKEMMSVLVTFTFLSLREGRTKNPTPKLRKQKFI